MDIALGLSLGGRRGSSDDALPPTTSTFLINALSGNDSNDGSPGAPLRTLAAGRAAALANGPGAVLSLAAGSVFRESLDLSGLSTVTVTAHGDVVTLGMPQVRGDDELSGAWQTAAERGDNFGTVYSQPFSWEGGETGETWLQFFEHPDGTDDVFAADVTHLAFAPSLSDCAATPGSFWIDAAELGADPAAPFTPASAANTVSAYVHPHGSTDARSDGKAYFGAVRQVGVRVGDDSLVREVAVYRAGNHVGAIEGKRRCVFDRCLAFDGVSQQMTMETGEFRDCIGVHRFADSRRDAIVIAFSSNAPDLRAEPCLSNRCMALATPAVRDSTNIDGFAAHRGANAERYPAWTLNDCAVVECRINPADAAAVTINRTSLRNGALQVADHGPGGSLTATDMSVTYDRVPATGKTGISTASAGTTPTTLDGLRLSVPDGVTGWNNLRHAKITQSILEMREVGTVSGNTFLLLTGGIDGTVSVDVQTTIFVTDEGFVRLQSNDAAVSDHNVFGGHGRWYASGTTVATSGNLAGWQSATALDANSITSAMRVADPLNGNWTITGAIGSTGAGLARPNVEYIQPPTTLSQAMSLIAGRDLTGGDFAPEDFA
ncbi:MAG: hypothetical protein AAGJ94_00100 [Pseudomonadota bacterium]